MKNSEQYRLEMHECPSKFEISERARSKVLGQFFSEHIFATYSNSVVQFGEECKAEHLIIYEVCGFGNTLADRINIKHL
jgi:hypothetical protein